MNFETIKRRAIELVEADGLTSLTCAKLSEACGISDGSFLHYAGRPFSQLVVELREAGHRGPGETSQTVPKRLPPDLRRDHIIDVGVELAAEVGFENLTRADVLERAGVSHQTFATYLGGLDTFRIEVIKRAVEREVLAVVAQALVAKHPLIADIPRELKNRAVASI